MCSREEQDQQTQHENAIIGSGKDVELQLPVMESKNDRQKRRHTEEGTECDAEHGQEKEEVESVCHWW